MPSSIKQHSFKSPVALSKAVLVLMAGYFLFYFLKDSYEELLFNPVHYFDDAYMFIRYAKIWHMGYGEAWNIGESPVYGNTSQLHFLVVLLLTSWPNIADDAVIKLASYVPAFILMLWLPWFALRHSPLFVSHARWQQYILWLGIIGPLVYWNTPYTYHFLTGMDTSLSALLQILLIDAVLSYTKLPDSRFAARYRYLAIIVFIIYLSYSTRPENLVTGILFSCVYIWLIAGQFRHAFYIGTAVFVLLILDGVFKYYYFGDFVPLAFYTKSSGFFDGFAGRFLNHAFFPIFACLLWIWPYLTVLIFSVRSKKQIMQVLIFVVPVLLTVAYFFTMLNIMNIKARYEFPFMFYFVALGIINVHLIEISKSRVRELSTAAIISILMWIGFRIGDDNAGNIVRYLVSKQGDPGLCSSPVLDDPADIPSPTRYTWQDKIVHITDVFTRAPTGVKVVTTEHGFFGVKNTHINIIDVAGLHNRHIAHEGFSIEWLYGQKPDVIWLPHWHYTCLNYRLVYNQEFKQHYRLFPGLFNLGIALRTESPHFPVLYDLIDRKVMELYPGYALKDFEKVNYQ